MLKKKKERTTKVIRKRRTLKGRSMSRRHTFSNPYAVEAANNGLYYEIALENQKKEFQGQLEKNSALYRAQIEDQQLGFREQKAGLKDEYGRLFRDMELNPYELGENGRIKYDRKNVFKKIADTKADAEPIFRLASDIERKLVGKLKDYNEDQKKRLLGAVNFLGEFELFDRGMKLADIENYFDGALNDIHVAEKERRSGQYPSMLRQRDVNGDSVFAPDPVPQNGVERTEQRDTEMDVVDVPTVLHNIVLGERTVDDNNTTTNAFTRGIDTRNANMPTHEMGSVPVAMEGVQTRAQKKKKEKQKSPLSQTDEQPPPREEGDIPRQASVIGHGFQTFTPMEEESDPFASSSSLLVSTAPLVPEERNALTVPTSVPVRPSSAGQEESFSSNNANKHFHPFLQQEENEHRFVSFSQVENGFFDEPELLQIEASNVLSSEDQTLQPYGEKANNESLPILQVTNGDPTITDQGDGNQAFPVQLGGMETQLQSVAQQNPKMFVPDQRHSPPPERQSQEGSKYARRGDEMQFRDSDVATARLKKKKNFQYHSFV